MARPAHVPTEAIRKAVEMMASVGTSQDNIAIAMEIDPKTLREHYRKELDTAMLHADAKVKQSLFNQAVNGNTAAAIFWLKVRCGWTEQQKIQISIKDMSNEQLVGMIATGAIDVNE